MKPGSGRESGHANPQRRGAGEVQVGKSDAAGHETGLPAGRQTGGVDADRGGGHDRQGRHRGVVTVTRKASRAGALETSDSRSAVTATATSDSSSTTRRTVAGALRLLDDCRSSAR